MRPVATQIALNHQTVSADALQMAQVQGFMAGIAGWSFFIFFVWRGWRFVLWGFRSLARWVVARRTAMRFG